MQVIPKFRINAAKFLLTYPKCTLTKEEMLSKLQVHGEIRAYLISIEKHLDETDHIHAVIQYNAKLDSRNPSFFDVEGFHPNIKSLKTMGDLQRAAKYASKDGNFITSGEILKSTREELFKAIIQAGEITAQFVRENPTVMALNFSSIKGWLGILGVPRRGTEHRDLEKKRHIWVHGDSNTGKSTWLYAFLKEKTSFLIPDNNDWNGCNVETEVLYADEYKGHLSVQSLNKLCDGCISLNTKGGSTRISQPLIVIVSNYQISDCYINCSSNILETLYNRFVSYLSPHALPNL